MRRAARPAAKLRRLRLVGALLAMPVTASAGATTTTAPSPTVATPGPTPSPAPAPALVRMPPPGCRPWPTVLAQGVSAEAADRLRVAPTTLRLQRADEFSVRDGRILVQPAAGEAGAIFSPAALAERRRLVDEELRVRKVSAYTSFHPLRGLLDDGAQFAAAVPGLLDHLRARLDGKMDPAMPASIDAAAARWRTAGCRPDAAILHELTAALGEVARARSSGTWATRVADDGVVEPVIEVRTPSPSPPRQLLPWAWALRLLHDDPPSADALLAEATAPPVPGPGLSPSPSPTAPPTTAPTVGPAPPHAP